MLELFTTKRLTLRRPEREDAAAIFEAYAADPDVTRYLSWAQHHSVEDSMAFIELSDSAWEAHRLGPLLIEERESGVIVGSTGVDYETDTMVSTGYVFAQEYWGQGFALEALQAVLEQLKETTVWRVEAICHTDNTTSVKVLEKAGFEREGILRRHTIFPNLAPEPQDVYIFSRVLW